LEAGVECTGRAFRSDAGEPRTLKQTSTFSGLATNYDAYQDLLNTSNPASIEWGAGTAAVTSALSGVADYSVSAPATMGIGVQGAVKGGNTAGVGMVGICTAATGTTVLGCWGANFVASDNGVVTNLWGTEIDINIQGTPAAAPANVYGYTAVTAGYQQSTGDFQAYAVQKAGSTGHLHYPWKDGFYSQDGAAGYGLHLNSVSLPETTPPGHSPLCLLL
jgi:hypothetical protein